MRTSTVSSRYPSKGIILQRSLFLLLETCVACQFRAAFRKRTQILGIPPFNKTLYPNMHHICKRTRVFQWCDSVVRYHSTDKYVLQAKQLRRDAPRATMSHCRISWIVRPIATCPMVRVRFKERPGISAKVAYSGTFSCLSSCLPMLRPYLGNIAPQLAGVDRYSVMHGRGGGSIPMHLQ